MSRIKLTSTPFDIITDLSDGNPGALTFLMEAFNEGVPEFFPTVLKLDTAEIYGPEAYILWNDCCDRDIKKTIQMIKKLDVDELRSYVIDRGYGKKYEVR